MCRVYVVLILGSVLLKTQKNKDFLCLSYLSDLFCYNYFLNRLEKEKINKTELSEFFKIRHRFTVKSFLQNCYDDKNFSYKTIQKQDFQENKTSIEEFAENLSLIFEDNPDIDVLFFLQQIVSCSMFVSIWYIFD